MSKQRAPEIRARYDWLEQNFPEVAGRIFFVTSGRGETPESIMSAEQRRVSSGNFDRDDAADIMNMVRAGVQTADNPLALPGAKLMALSSGATIALVDTGKPEHHTVITLMTMPFLFKSDPGRLNAMKNMLATYAAEQEIIHAVDMTSQGIHGKTDEYHQTVDTMRNEVVGEVYSTLRFLQRDQRGELAESVAPFLDSIQQHHRVAQLGDVRGTHTLVDEAMGLARDWAKGRDLRSMNPRDMLEQSRQLADQLQYPTQGEISAFREKVSSYDQRQSSPLYLFNLPSAEQEEVVGRVAAHAGQGWAGRQLTDAFNALVETHKPGPHHSPDVCWPAGSEDRLEKVSPASETATAWQRFMLGKISAPVGDDGVIMSAVLCEDRNQNAPSPSSPHRTPKPGPFDDMR